MIKTTDHEKKINPQVFIKIGSCFMFKTYFISSVSEECFNNSESVEHAGSLICYKVKNQNHLKFMVKELENKGYVREVEI